MAGMNWRRVANEKRVWGANRKEDPDRGVLYSQQDAAEGGADDSPFEPRASADWPTCLMCAHRIAPALFEAHDCSGQLITCSYCPKLLRRRSRVAHVTTDCSGRVTCPKCRRKVLRRELQAHTSASCKMPTSDRGSNGMVCCTKCRLGMTAKALGRHSCRASARGGRRAQPPLAATVCCIACRAVVKAKALHGHWTHECGRRTRRAGPEVVHVRHAPLLRATFLLPGEQLLACPRCHQRVKKRRLQAHLSMRCKP
jgi:hypothetical protein